jgi:hypothetical protein
MPSAGMLSVEGTLPGFFGSMFAPNTAGVADMSIGGPFTLDRVGYRRLSSERFECLALKK